MKGKRGWIPLHHPRIGTRKTGAGVDGAAGGRETDATRLHPATVAKTVPTVGKTQWFNVRTIGALFAPDPANIWNSSCR